jgi:PAS domain S-box-containing protein
MMHHLKYLLAGCLLIACAVAEAAGIRFQHLSREEGLSQSFVLSVAQDQEGFMWFGTQSGLNRFDGHEVRVFTQAEGLPDNIVRSLLMDSRGRLWVGTDNGGVALYEPKTERFTTLNTENSGLPTNRVRTLFEDASGNILVGTDGAGVWRFDEELEDFRSYVSFVEPLSQSIWAFAETASGDLLIGTGHGVYRKTAGEAPGLAFSDINQGLLDEAHVRTLLSDANGNVWVGTEASGLVKISQDGSSRTYEFADELSGRQVFHLLEDNDGTIWVATSGGLNEIVGSEVFHYRNNPENTYSLSSDMVTRLYQDRGGVIWVASYAGINFWSPNLYVADTYFSKTSSDAQLSSSAITSFAESPDGSIWLGTIGGGLNRVAPDGSVKNFNKTTRLSLPDKDVMSLYVDSKDQLWIGTRTAGLVLFDPNRGVLKTFARDEPEPYQLNANAITSISESQFGALLVGTYGGGFHQIDLQSFQVERFQAGSESNSLPSNRIMFVLEDSQGGLWLGTDGAGLVHYDRYRQEFTRYHDGKAGFTGDLVLTGREDTQGNLWFGTMNNGAYWLPLNSRDEAGMQFRQLTTDDGLTSDSVYSLEVDDSSGVWFSSNVGISHLEAIGEMAHGLSLRNGLQDLEFNSGASLKLSNGDLLFGGTNGFNRISPADVNHQVQPPQTAITAISRQGYAVPAAFARQNGIELSHQDYFLEFKFSGLDYGRAASTRFRYRLVGLQSDWVSAGTRRYASYNNLLPGEYVFEVQASNSDGIWSPQPERVRVLVHPAPWFSFWAYLIYAMVITAILLMAYRGFVSRREHIAEVQAMNLQLRNEVETRREAEAQIRREREKTRRYVDVAEVMLVTLDVEGRMLHVNENAVSMLGDDVESLVGKSLLDFVSAPQRHNLRQKILAVFDAEDSGDHFECQLCDQADNIHTVIWRFAPLSESGGHAREILASGTDITELRHLERAVGFKEKLSALGTLSAGIAHDFNNILTAITGYNDLALESVEPSSPARPFLQNVEQASARATDLVARIMSVTQLDDGRLVTQDLNQAVKESVHFFKAGLPDNVRLVENYPDQPLPVDADASQLQQLLLNLGSNATAALNGDGGRLDVYIERKSLAQADLPRGANLEPGDFALLHFKDTGSGMPEAMRQKIFDPFYSSHSLGDKERTGAGLGLSIVHGIVLNHKGHIEVESHLGMGSHFTIYLPISRTELDRRVVSLADVRATSRRVMLVDDEEWIVDVAARLLTSLGLEVEAFVHPLEALERFKSGSNDFSLLITDQNMPHMKGVELIEAVRKIRDDVNVVLMSGNVSPLPDDDPSYFMAKPFRLADLKAILEKVGLHTGAESRGVGS